MLGVAGSEVESRLWRLISDVMSSSGMMKGGDVCDTNGDGGFEPDVLYSSERATIQMIGQTL